MGDVLFFSVEDCRRASSSREAMREKREDDNVAAEVRLGIHHWSLQAVSTFICMKVLASHETRRRTTFTRT